MKESPIYLPICIIRENISENTEMKELLDSCIAVAKATTIPVFFKYEYRSFEIYPHHTVNELMEQWNHSCSHPEYKYNAVIGGAQ